MFCKKCGREMEEGEIFCRGCGTKAGEAPAAGAGIYGGPKNPLGRVNFGGLKSGYLKISVIVFSVLMMLSVLLPCYKFNEWAAAITGVDSFSLLKQGDQWGDGVILLLLLGLMILFVCLNKKLPVLLCGILNLVVYFVDIHKLSQIIQKERELQSLMSKDSGYYLMPVFGVLLMAAAVLYFLQKD